jgi:CheY-like chemotaxis protein
MTKRYAVIIEDNLEITDVYKQTLQMVDYDTECFVDGRAALERLQDIEPDLIVLDMNLPQVSGHYIYKRIRADPRLKSTRVIISTANSIVADALSKDLDDNDYMLIKPVSAKRIREIAESL